jgi:hypothetical protein
MASAVALRSVADIMRTAPTLLSVQPKVMVSAADVAASADLEREIKAKKEGNRRIFCSLRGLAHFVAVQRTSDATGRDCCASDAGILATIRAVSNERKAGAASAASA